jgi:DegV family protein with EDD domain
MSFKIVVDSCCDLTSVQLSDPCFSKVALTIQVGSDLFVDDAQLDQAALLHAMRHCPTAPSTACPSPQQYMDAFDCGADDIYVVCLSALLSGSHNSAEQARALFQEEHPDVRIKVFNSCSASAGEALLALKLRDLAQSGLPFDGVVAEANQFIGHMNTLFVLDSLDNLRKSGRLTALQSLVTGTLRLKLLMGATPAGEICKRGQALSTKQALAKMVELISTDASHTGRTLFISHCNCLERAYALQDLILKRCFFSDIRIGPTGGISTVYANDGGIVIAY